MNDTAVRTSDIHDHTEGMGYKSQLLTWPVHSVLIPKSVICISSSNLFVTRHI